nr:alpha/beta hydrolase [Sphingomicrobium nitratireducens]
MTEDGTGLAYSIAGDGPPLVKAANWLNHLEYDWDSPLWRHWIGELAAFSTLVRYDERGNGLSDWDTPTISFEAFVDDLETVVDAAGLERFDLLGISQGCAVSIAYAVRHPQRVRRLVLYGGYAQGWAKRGDDPEALAAREAMMTLIRTGWGRDNPAFRQMFTTLFMPDADPDETRWFNELQRVSTSPDNAVALQKAFSTIDVMDIVDQVSVPTLVLHARDDAVVPFSQGRAIAARIKGAEFVALDSANHMVLDHEPAWARAIEAMRDFLTRP